MALVSKETEKVLLIAGGVAIIALYFAAKKTATVIKEDVLPAINPADDNNLINRGVSSVVQTATDGKSKSLGDYLFCLFNPDSIICNPERAALNPYYDTKELSDEQVSMILEQEKEFIDNADFITPVSGFIAPTEQDKTNPLNSNIRY